MNAFRHLILFLTITVITFGVKPKNAADWAIIRTIGGAEKTIDSFGRDRVGAPYQIGGYFFTYSLLPEAFGTSVSGTGSVTHDPTMAVAKVQATAGTGRARLRSHQYHLYQPDKAQEVVLSLTPFSAKQGVTKKWGYYDDNDGLYFKLEDDNKLQVCLLTSTSGAPVENCVDQNNFNYFDDGNAREFIKEQWTPDGATIYAIEFQWLGSGVVKFYVADKNGLFQGVHAFKNPLQYNVPYMKRAALPVQWEIQTDGTNTEADKIHAICASVVNNGGEQPTVNTFASFLPNVGTTSGTSETHIMSFRLKDTYKGQVNTTTVFPQSLDLVADGGTVRFRVYQNCTVTGASWTDVNATYSAAEYSTAGTISSCQKLVEARTLFGSTKAGTTIGSQGSVGFRAFKVVKEAFNGGGVFSVTVQRSGSTEANYDISLRWGESR